MFQVKAQEEPSGASHSRLLILFPLNYRTSDKKKKLKPCVFSNNGVYREGVTEARKNSVFSFSALLDLLRDGSVRDFYRFNTLPQHLVDPHGKEGVSRKITLVGLFCSLQLPNQTIYF